MNYYPCSSVFIRVPIKFLVAALPRCVSLASIILSLLLLSACGGDGSSGGGGSAIYTTQYNNVTTIAGKAGKTGSADGTGTGATFYSPIGITTDGTNLYVADTYNSTIRQIAIATGAVATVAGSSGWNAWYDGTGEDAAFYYPSGITTYGTTLYVADTSAQTIRKIN